MVSRKNNFCTEHFWNSHYIRTKRMSKLKMFCSQIKWNLSLNWVYTELMETLILWTQTKTITWQITGPGLVCWVLSWGDFVLWGEGGPGPSGNLYIHTFTSQAPRGLHTYIMVCRKIENGKNITNFSAAGVKKPFLFIPWDFIISFSV